MAFVSDVSELHALRETQEDTAKTVMDYQQTITKLIDARENEKQVTRENFNLLKKERELALENLQSVENGFAQLERRNERLKTAIEGYKKNEEVLLAYIKAGQLTQRKQEQKFELLKRHAEETLASANEEIQDLRRAKEAEVVVLRAQLKEAEMTVESLEKSVQRMNKKNCELTCICEEFVANVRRCTS